MARRLRIALVAGEASGDLLGAGLMAAIKNQHPDAEFVGIGGPKMQSEGLDSWWPLEMLSVMGYVDALKRYREISGMRSKLLTRLKNWQPDVFVGIDAPDFNLGLETKLRASGVPTIHYVSPSIWAWRGGRIKKIARAVSRVLALFPMEPPLYEKAGIPVTYVGHPLADRIPRQNRRETYRDRLGLSRSTPVFALLPGSRKGELEMMADCFVDTAKIIREALPAAQFVVPFTTRETRLQFETAIYRRQGGEVPFRLLFGHAQDALGAADVALVKSGTSTLEAALLQRPMVITYRIARMSHWLMKKMAYLPYVGLPNILLGRFVVPELLQDEATPEKLAGALVALYHDTDRRTEIETAFGELHDTLRQNASERAAAAVLACLN